MPIDNVPSSMPTENPTVDGNLITFQKGIAQAINDTYSYADNSLFYAMMPVYYQSYAWRYIRPACQWLDGYVPNLHQSGLSGIVSTRIASALITGLTKQIVGEKLVFKPSDIKKYTQENLKFIGNWAEKQNIIKAVYAAIGYALAIGTSLLKMNRTIDGEIWWEAVRFDYAFIRGSFKNEIKEATFLIRGYTDTGKEQNKEQFFLVEKRFYYTYTKPEMTKNPDGSFTVLHKIGDREARVRYEIHRVRGQLTNSTMSGMSNVGLNWQELPGTIKEMVKDDYGAIRINEDKPLGFRTLGVVALLNGQTNLSIPTGTNLGESMLVPCQDDFITYEIASSYLIRDMYLGKGTVYVPKSASMANYTPGLVASGGVMHDLGEEKYETIPGVNPDEQKIIVQQFELREQSWQTIKENCLKNIAVKWGMSPKILASFLTQGSAAMTATQIDSEDDSCIAFIYHTRSYFKNPINRLLDETLAFYGKESEVDVDFASPSLINKDRILNRVTTELEAGLIDVEDAVRTLNPDLDEEALQVKIETAKNERANMMMSGMETMNPDGSFGPMPSDDELEGTTVPIG